MELEQAILFAALTLTGWIALSLLVERRGDTRVNRPLAALLLTLCAPLAYFYSHSLNGGMFWLGQLALAGIWIKGPLLRLLTGAAVNVPLGSPTLHFAPFVIASILMPTFPKWSQVLGLAGLIHALGYLAVSAKHLFSGRSYLARIYQGYPNSAFYWLLFVIAGLSVVMLLDLLLMGPGLARGQLPLWPIKLTTLTMVTYLLTIAICSLYRPATFFSHKAETYQPTNDPLLEVAPTAIAPEKKTVPERLARELSLSVAQQLQAKLHALMAQDQLYLDAELNLPKLAESLDITTHQASELLNLHMGDNFYDYVNNLRLEHAARLLQNPSCSLRIIDVAYQSGFNNKNSFYRLFRQKFAMTPSAYRSAKGQDQAFIASVQSISTENDSRAEHIQ